MIVYNDKAFKTAVSPRARASADIFEMTPPATFAGSAANMITEMREMNNPDWATPTALEMSA